MSNLGIVRRVGNIDIELYGVNQQRLIEAHAVYKKYIYDHSKKLNKNSLKNPPFVTKQGNDSTKQTFLIFMDTKNEGAYLKALQELGTACLMFSGLDTENSTMFLVDEADVAERAAKNIGITITPDDYVTVKFVDGGLPEPQADIDPELVDGRGVGEMMVFAVGFKNFLDSNDLELKGGDLFRVEPIPIMPDEFNKNRESCQETLAFAGLWSNEVLRGGNNAE